MTTQKANPTLSYFVPGELLFAFESAAAPSMMARSAADTARSLVSHLESRSLLPDGGFDFGVEKGTRIFRAASLMVDHPDRAGVLLKLKLANPRALPGYLERAVATVANDAARNVAGDAPRLLAVSPNWLAGASQGGIGTGGPGTTPSPAKRAGEFKVSFLSSVPSTSNGVAPDVFVLDTSPPLQETKDGWRIRDAVQDKSAFSAHPLGEALSKPLQPHPNGGLRSADGTLTMIQVDALGPDLFAGLKDIGGHPLYAAHHPAYDMSDHGLFIAGIIRQIAPQARIHLVQVLNEYGVGTLASIAAGFARVARSLQNGKPASPVIVNCSFTLALPLPGEAGNPRRPGHPIAMLDQAMAKLIGTAEYLASVRRLFRALAPFGLDAAQCIVVAAAGNDSSPEAIRPARFPAQADFVLGVGALARPTNGGLSPAQPRAPYSNLADKPQSDGLMVLGDLEGVFTQRFPGNAPNPFGFARWAGTSFATGVVSALIARLCAGQGLTPGQARDYLRNLPQGVTSESEEIVLIEQM
ncbi:MAG: S8/S53 family peptidase [Anaerolineae bacterium]|nr:S8/S53 family peptidase [Candidatus Roseilinea sp.]MDW8448923.1 S8/S53 family peptidase [Anaerolineae bacterium]